MIEVLLIAPVALEIIEMDFAGLSLADDGVMPVGQLDDHAGCLAAVKLGGAGFWCGESKPLTGRLNRDLIANFGLDGDDMGQRLVLLSKEIGNQAIDGQAVSEARNDAALRVGGLKRKRPVLAH